MANPTPDETIDEFNIMTDLAAAIEVTDAELDLLEAHLSGLVSRALNLPE